ncbi:hypothetical protein CTI12_AA058330 [Artemisia annua]|uniref:CCHC-type domain-containing protein n=1 Tax=Artemisia annua TaxID=35608 RepID=A0A2U1Q9G8_ARTAN|nr:hypothetical protein CTI12_AA058330 [Artemisia annua]
MVNTRRNGQPNGGSDEEPEIPNLEAMVATAIANMLPGLNANEVISRLVSDIRNGQALLAGLVVVVGPLPLMDGLKSLDAEDWITHMEKLFEVLGCEDEFKTRMATFKLEGDALNWWRTHRLAQAGNDNPAIYTWAKFRETFYKRTHRLAQGGNDNPAICTWAKFRETFYKRYFPMAEQERFEREYNYIYQLNSENSGEYMRRFVRLASFVGPIAGDARRQAKHFKWGLKKWVLDRLLNTEFTDVSAVNDAARNIEIFHEGSCYKRSRDGERIQNRAQGNDSRGFSGRGDDSRGQMDRGLPTSGVRLTRVRISGPLTELGMIGSVLVMVITGNGRTSLLGVLNRTVLLDHLVSTNLLRICLLCSSCGKPHPGTCHKLTGACFRCGSTTHGVKDCPKANSAAPANTPRLPAPSGRVFTTIHDQAAGTSDSTALGEGTSAS